MHKEIYQYQARVLDQHSLAPQIMSLTLSAPPIAAAARPGQFVNLYCNDGSRMLPRPISICEADPAAGTIRLVYRISGGGTLEFSRQSPGDWLDVLGPLGNGFLAAGIPAGRALLVGGGIGIPPMLALAKALPGEKTIVLGYRNQLFLQEAFAKALPGEGKDRLHFATEDGSAGIKGTVLDAIREHALEGDVLYACGPTPMLRALKEWALTREIPCYLSLEQRMACGVGACLACVCDTVQDDPHTRVKRSRVCLEGPVFEAREVVL